MDFTALHCQKDIIVNVDQTRILRQKEQLSHQTEIHCWSCQGQVFSHIYMYCDFNEGERIGQFKYIIFLTHIFLGVTHWNSVGVVRWIADIKVCILAHCEEVVVKNLLLCLWYLSSAKLFSWPIDIFITDPINLVILNNQPSKGQVRIVRFCC